MANTVNPIVRGSKDSSGILAPLKFTRRRATGDKDVQFEVMFCGVSHSDLHLIKNDWGFANYPMIMGLVTEVGPGVSKFKPGDKVAVGVMVGSCGNCDYCSFSLENFFPEKLGTLTYGGDPDLIIVEEDFVIRWPENFPMGRRAPLVCAGITTYSPLMDLMLRIFIFVCCFLILVLVPLI
ncbi:Cinnamyl alcohol dehydrogenase 8 [Striga hermonthica]|uniref:Cinnamyl alcohol dehydrogenase 8 n=1 Tax=Striga hermonthica TaxID=68872 RepID=A0A9N7RNU1_STRHE|nr:Cinnamyl alcohol dehydrogenase 8 [Striga hermonthica]